MSGRTVHARAGLLDFFRTPARCEEYGLQDWERLFILARVGKVLAQVAGTLRERDLERHVPEQARWLLRSAWVRYERSRRQMLWEVERLGVARRFADGLMPGAPPIPVVLLKGAAYHALEMPWANGRMSVDVDIMVPLDAISRFECALNFEGWFAQKKSQYDDRYYRDWMHEIPPMTHAQRGTTLDVHHTILPRTGRITVDARRLFENARPLSDGFFTLAPEDMFLHAAVHMFQDGELAESPRDLLDLDGMLRHFARDEQFARRLPERAGELGVQRPCFYAVHFAVKMLGTPIPEALRAQVDTFAPARPVRIAMDVLAPWAVLPEIPGGERARVRLARLALYVRSHLLRMPLRMLIPHLWHKWRVRRAESRELHQAERKKET